MAYSVVVYLTCRIHKLSSHRQVSSGSLLPWGRGRWDPLCKRHIPGPGDTVVMQSVPSRLLLWQHHGHCGARQLHHCLSYGQLLSHRHPLCQRVPVSHRHLQQHHWWGAWLCCSFGCPEEHLPEFCWGSFDLSVWLAKQMIFWLSFVSLLEFLSKSPEVQPVLCEKIANATLTWASACCCASATHHSRSCTPVLDTLQAGFKSLVSKQHYDFEVSAFVSWGFKTIEFDAPAFMVHFV